MSLNDINRLRTNTLADQNRILVYKQSRVLQKSLQKLSTGLKNPRAEDDAASFSISAKLRGRIGGLRQAEQNIIDARSVISMMDESLKKIIDLLIDVKQKVLKAANAVAGSQERNFIQNTINGIAREVNSIVDQTSYNGINLLEEGYSATFQTGEQIAQTLSISITDDLRAQDLQVEKVTSLGVLSSGGGGITTGMSLNALDQFANLQGGDTFDIVLTRGDGTTDTINFTAAGSKGQLTTSSVLDLLSAINSRPDFQATYNGSDGAIEVIESAPTVGNALAVNFGNFSEAPGLDGATENLNFSVDSSTGTLKANLSGAGINVGTNLNSFSQFSLLEGDDVIAMNLRGRDGVNYSVSLTISGGSAQAGTSDLGDLIAAVNFQTGGKFNANVSGGQFTITEQSLARNSLNTSAGFTENNLDTGPASVSAVSFTQKPTEVALGGISGISGATRLDDLTRGIGQNFSSGDTFDIALRNNDGSTTNITYTFGSPADTYQDVINYVNGNSSFTASISGGELVISEGSRTSGTQLGGSFTNYTTSGGGTFTNQSFNVVRDTELSSEGDFGSVSTADILNNLSEFTNVQEGDQLQLNMTDNAGGNQSVTFTFTGTVGDAADSTIQNLINAINSTSLSASLDAGLGAIVITDSLNSGTNLSFSFSNTDFTENPQPPNGSINLSFNYDNSEDGMVSNTLTSGGIDANSGTRLNDLDGWGTLEGDDVIQITLQTRSGSSQNFNFQLNDVAAGAASNATVGDLVSFINNRSIGTVNFDASLNSGAIVVTEDNPPPVNGFGATANLTENNIDINPTVFTNAQFQIAEFLQLGNDTGLVFGLGLLDFDSGTNLTQSAAQKLVQNVDDSIDRVINNANRLGVAQTQLENRQNFVSRSIISNEAARSRITDVDYAREYSKLIKNQIIRQYQLAASVQANLTPQYLLALL